jgi:hypothetical protein
VGALDLRTALRSHRCDVGSIGIPTVRITLLGAAFSIDLNFAAVVAALVSLGAILAIYWHDDSFINKIVYTTYSYHGPR